MAVGKKYGGRQKGVPNKSKRALIALLRETYPGYHPVLSMAKIAHETDDVALQAQMHREIAQYVEPKRKAVEHSGEVGTRVSYLDALAAIADRPAGESPADDSEVATLTH